MHYRLYTYNVCLSLINYILSPSTEERHQAGSHQHARENVGHSLVARFHGSGVEQDLMREELDQT